MIYPISNKQQTRNKKQAGVTLILAILVLSSLMAISFSLATILFIEVRSSSDVLRSEGAYYATNGVTEQALFNYRRNLPAGALSYSTSFGAVTATTPVPKVYGDAILQDVVPKNQTFQNTANHYALFNVGNPSGIANPPAFPLAGSGYGEISITYLDTGNPDSLSIYICQFDPLELVDTNGTGSNTYQSVPCTNPAHPSNSLRDYWLVNGTDISGKLDHGLNLTQFLDPTKMQELILVNNGNSAQDIYVKIQTFTPDSNNPGQFITQGLPYFSKKVVDISATNSTVTRKLRVIIPASGTTALVGNTANFVKTDSVTKGGWEAAGYGAAGYNLLTSVNDPGSYPGYVTVTPTGNSWTPWTIPTPIGDPRALKPKGGGTQFIDTWYSSPSWSLDFNFTDGSVHQVAMYMVDWDSPNNRSQRVDVLNGDTSAVLDTRNVSNFSGGQYWVWNLSGHIKVQFTQTGVANAVISAIFFQ